MRTVSVAVATSKLASKRIGKTLTFTLIKDLSWKSQAGGDRIVVLAGQRYRESLMDYLRQHVRTVEIPMEGLTIGRQLQYLTGGLHHDRL
jgi:hypothetical protein